MNLLRFTGSDSLQARSFRTPPAPAFAIAQYSSEMSPASHDDWESISYGEEIYFCYQL